MLVLASTGSEIVTSVSVVSWPAPAGVSGPGKRMTSGVSCTGAEAFLAALEARVSASRDVVGAGRGERMEDAVCLTLRGALQ